MTRSVDICAVRNHTTLGEAGACPRCRQEFIDSCSDGPHAWIVSFPETGQIAVVRNWIPDEPLQTAWATGCNTGGWASCTPLDPVLIEASGVELFTLLSGSEAGAALAALGAR